MDGTVEQLVELLPHSTSDPGSILTLGSVCAELTHSPFDFPLCTPVSFYIQKTRGFAD